MTYEANKVSLVRYKGHLTRVRSLMDEAVQLSDLKRVNTLKEQILDKLDKIMKHLENMEEFDDAEPEYLDNEME